MSSSNTPSPAFRSAPARRPDPGRGVGTGERERRRRGARTRAFGARLRAVFLAASLALALLFQATTAQQPTAAVPAEAANEITVRAGDSLWAIAQRHDTTVQALQSRNGLVGHDLRPGMVLVLPDGSDTQPTEHTVQTGDTLYEIANTFDLSVDDLIAYNDLEGSFIRPGQVLTLRAEGTGEAARPIEVTVDAGDTLWEIARRFDTRVGTIAVANGIDPNATLALGTRLRIPGRYGDPESDQGGAATPEMTVAPGDTLWAIARRNDTSVAALMNANGLTSERLHAGQRLRIVAGADLGRAAEPRPAPTPAVAQGMVWPLVGTITSRFGYRRLRIGGSNMHYGIDIDGVTGEAIRAATSGVVIHAGWQGGYGNLVVIEQGDTEYLYAHASAIHIQVGQVVQAGQTIASVGSTGRSTGSHLHFEIRVGGDAVDPLPILQMQASR